VTAKPTPSALLAFARTPGFSYKKRRALLSRPEALSGLALVDPEPELQAARDVGAELVAWGDDRYPASWSPLEGWPPVFWVKGAWPPTLAAEVPHAVAVVGARRASEAGQRFTFGLGRALAAAGAWVVSGLAFGIDAAAHRGALAAAGHASTVAVLAGGLATVQPRSHTQLAKSIVAAGGGLMSAAPIQSVPIPGHFPARNRLIAGLAAAVAVVEAAASSGSLHTVAAALDHGRQVFAAPARPWDTHAAGSLQLLREGAEILLHADDILTHLSTSFPAGNVAHQTGRPELWSTAATGECIRVEALTSAAGLGVAEALATLERAVIEGKLARVGDGSYRIL
jgi:DNA processing protein